MSRRLVQRVIPVGTVDTLGGDAVGDPAANTVVAIQHQPWDSGTPSVGEVATWDGTQWTFGVPASGQPGFGEVCYVDLATGNDATALRGRIDLKFLTIQAAVDAAATGDVIDLGPGIFDEAVVMDGAAVDYLTFIGHGRSTYPGVVSSGTCWMAPSGDVPLTLIDCSAQVVHMSMLGTAALAIEANCTSANSIFLLAIDVISTGTTALNIDTLGSLRCDDVAPIGNVIVTDCDRSDWVNGTFEPDEPYSLTIADGTQNGLHIFHTGGYGDMVISGRAQVQLNSGVTVSSVDGSAYTTSGATFTCSGTVTGATLLDPRATIALNSGVYQGQVSIESAGGATYVNATAATFIGIINVGDNIALDLTRAKYNTSVVLLGTGSSADYTDHTNDDQHGARSAYMEDNVTLLHPIVSVSTDGFMTPAMLAQLNGVASLTSTAPVNVGNVAAAAGVGTTAARHDHQHDVNFGTAVDLTDSTNASGSATTLALSDHTHAHGNRGGGSLHALADSVNAGFMSAADFVELGTTTATANAAVPNTRQVIAGAGLTGGGALTGDVTLDVGAIDPSIVVGASGIQVGILQSDASHGVRGGGTQHAAVTSVSNGFATPAMLAATGRTVIRTPGAYPYTIASTDLVIKVDSSTTRTIQLPDPSTYTGICWVHDWVGSSGTNTITLARFNSETIQGYAQNMSLIGGFAKWGVYSDGTNWGIL